MDQVLYTYNSCVYSVLTSSYAAMKGIVEIILSTCSTLDFEVESNNTDPLVYTAVPIVYTAVPSVYSY